jgi:hypothetical protein
MRLIEVQNRELRFLQGIRYTSCFKNGFDKLLYVESKGCGVQENTDQVNKNLKKQFAILIFRDKLNLRMTKDR